MRLNQIDANLLVALDVLLEERSVTGAARRLGVSQSAMSQTLGRLRATFGDPLLTRMGNSMEPTPRAQALAVPLKTALNDLEAVLSVGPEFEPGLARREFSIATTDYGAFLLIRPLMVRLEKMAPGLSVRVVQLGGDLLRLLEGGDADLLLSVAPRLPRRIHSKVLFHENYRCLVHHTHPLVDVPPTDRERWLDVFCNSAHVLVGRSGRGRGAVDRLLEAEGRSRHIALRVPYFLAAAPVVQTTRLVLTTPSRAALLFAHENPELEVLDPPMELPSFAVAAMWHTRYEHDPGLRWLRHVLTEAVQALVSAP